MSVPNSLKALIFLALAFSMALIPLMISAFRKKPQQLAQKTTSYECGFEPFEKDRRKFDIRFAVLAVLFIIFDVEIALLIPWALNIREISWISMVSVTIFLVVLVIGFIYEWKKEMIE